ncbi:hypothetical protein MR813_06360 [bacterium]|nr:hypothetical protein [bacterium]
MRFVAGRGAVTELLMAEAPWRRGWRHCGREPSGRCCWQGHCSEAPSGSCCWPEFPAGRQCGSIGKQLRRVTI